MYLYLYYISYNIYDKFKYVTFYFVCPYRRTFSSPSDVKAAFGRFSSILSDGGLFAINFFVSQVVIGQLGCFGVIETQQNRIESVFRARNCQFSFLSWWLIVILLFSFSSYESKFIVINCVKSAALGIYSSHLSCVYFYLLEFVFSMSSHVLFFVCIWNCCTWFQFIHFVIIIARVFFCIFLQVFFSHLDK